jgi:uncharacterized protein (TIGR02145 family)
MKKQSNFFLAIVFFAALAALGGCDKDPVLSTVKTALVSDITTVSAVSGGEIISDGGSQITSRGVCWGARTNPEVTDSHTNDGEGVGIFSSNLTGLTPGLTYYIRAYAKNSAGTAYGEEVIFNTTAVVEATVTTEEVIFVNSTSALAGGKITSEGGGEVTARGVCWATDINPTVNDSYTTDGTGGGPFTSTLTNLDPNTLYYVRAYATNTAGTAYGEQMPYFSGSITDIEGNEYPVMKIGTQLWMAENLKTTKFNDGSVIEIITDNYGWADATTPAYSWYNNDMNTFKSKYGAFYNWYTVNTGKLCPSGWHVPSDSEYKTLEKYLGMTQEQADNLGPRGTDQGVQMKSKSGWLNNGNGINTSGFKALPGGVRNHSTGAFMNEGFVTGFWSSTENNQEQAFYRYLFGDQNTVGRDFLIKSAGKYIRCIKD